MTSRWVECAKKSLRFSVTKFSPSCSSLSGRELNGWETFRVPGVELFWYQLIELSLWTLLESYWMSFVSSPTARLSFRLSVLGDTFEAKIIYSCILVEY
jgi:hypothetical protein